MYLISNFFILIMLSSACQPARILAVFPTPSISHQVVFRPLTQELAKRGHEVVVITADPAYPKGKAPENLVEIDVHNVSYNMWREEILSSATTSGKSSDIKLQMTVLRRLLSRSFEAEMVTEEVQQVINNRTNHYDLIIVEACIRPAVSLSYLFKVPLVQVSSLIGVMKNYDVLGAPNRPLLHYPGIQRQKIYNMSLWDKVVELYNHYLLDLYCWYAEDEDNEMIRRLFGPEIPSISELENNVQMVLLNAHPIWDSNRPVPPNIIYMGGLHQKPSKELSEELKTYLDSSKHGVIYISFGTNVDPAYLPPERIELLIRVLAKLPYDVLWKWNQDDLPNRPNNIRISKWFPQSDLLKHPNVKLFITQGGLQSTDEAITAGVPLIGMPMLGDQWFNVEQYVYHKIGIRMDLETLTEDAFLDGINKVITDISYRKNTVRLRTIMSDQPQQPLDRAIWWLEHVIRHGGATHLRAKVANMSWTEYLDVELMAVLFLLFITVVIVLSVVLLIAFWLIRKYVLQKTLSFKAKLKSS